MEGSLLETGWISLPIINVPEARSQTEAEISPLAGKAWTASERLSAGVVTWPSFMGNATPCFLSISIRNTGIPQGIPSQSHKLSPSLQNPWSYQGQSWSLGTGFKWRNWHSLLLQLPEKPIGLCL